MDNKELFLAASKAQKKIRIELGLADDLQSKYQRAAGSVAGIKSTALKAAVDLRSVVNDLIDVRDGAKKAEAQAKQLGADDLVKKTESHEFKS